MYKPSHTHGDETKYVYRRNDFISHYSLLFKRTPNKPILIGNVNLHKANNEKSRSRMEQSRALMQLALIHHATGKPPCKTS